MDGSAIVAIIGGAVVAFAVRAFNVVLEWLAKVLDVEPSTPIPEPGATTESTPVSSQGDPPHP